MIFVMVSSMPAVMLSPDSSMMSSHCCSRAIASSWEPCLRTTCTQEESLHFLIMSAPITSLAG